MLEVDDHGHTAGGLRREHLGRRRRVVVAVSVAAALAVACAVLPQLESPPVPRQPPQVGTRWVVDPSTTVPVSDLIGPHAAGGDTETRFGVAGTDLGHMFTVGGRLAIPFGDTYGPPPAERFFDVRHVDWRSNVLGWIDPPASPGAGLAMREMVSDRPGHATELLHSRKQDGVEQTVIPTYGITVGSQMLLHYMSVRSFSGPGRWSLNAAGVAASRDGGRTWSRPPEATWPGPTRFGQVAYVYPGGPDDPGAPDPPSFPGVPRLPSLLPTPHHGTVYVYGIPGGRYGDVSLAAVPAGRMLDRSAYRYWTGRDWSADEKAAATVVRGPVGELSVRWNSWYRTWLMMYLVDPTGDIVLRRSPSPTGPWGPPEVVTTTHSHPEAYAPYLTPRWTDGPDIWFTLSQYQSYRVSVMRTRMRAQPHDRPRPGDVSVASPPGIEVAGRPGAPPPPGGRSS